MSKEQIAFLKSEMGITERDYFAMSIEELRNLREKCFDIEVGEVVDADNEGRDPLPKAEIAAHTVDAILDRIKDLKKTESKTA